MVNAEYIREFYKSVSQNLEGNYKIILEHKRNLLEEWIEYDCVKWEIEKPVEKYLNILIKESTISLEEKIIKLYEFICLNYIYDANVLFFFRKDSSDPENVKYIPADWYGRIIDQEWRKKREHHNRRICYEFARCYAKAINTLIDDKQSLEAFILADKGNTHYVVGLTGEKYSVILDQDDFNSIKDLTRLKMGLTIKGIHILKDSSSKFKLALNEYNKNRLDEPAEIMVAKEYLKNKNVIEYFKAVLKTLIKYNIDSQGIFEYLRNVIENAGIEIEKVWKEDTANEERRYERCLYFNFDAKTYLLDSICKTLNEIDLHSLDKKLFIFKPEENEYKYYGG